MRKCWYYLQLVFFIATSITFEINTYGVFDFLLSLITFLFNWYLAGNHGTCLKTPASTEYFGVNTSENISASIIVLFGWSAVKMFVVWVCFWRVLHHEMYLITAPESQNYINWMLMKLLFDSMVIFFMCSSVRYFWQRKCNCFVSSVSYHR
jgi:hypothetical protein